MTKLFSLLGVLGALLITYCSAQVELPHRGYLYVQQFVEKTVKVPTIVEVVSGLPSRAIVIDETSNELVPIMSRLQTVPVLPERVDACQNDACRAAPTLADRNSATTYDFSLDKEGVNLGSVTITFAKPITTSRLVFQVDANSYRPATFSLYVDGKLVLNKTSTDSTFPEMTGSTFSVRFSYTQPIRFTEVSVGEDNTHYSSARFVYVPGHMYALYSNPTYNELFNPQSPANLYDPKQKVEAVVLVPEATVSRHYIELDTDKDGISDSKDNCRYQANSDQSDENGNLIGDVCDDHDFDGVVNAKDNCALLYNPDQKDTDADMAGDVCDGAESRFTEAHPWLPWLALLTVFGLVIGMGYSVVRTMAKRKEGIDQSK